MSKNGLIPDSKNPKFTYPKRVYFSKFTSDIRKICDITGDEFICTSSDMARAFGMSDDEMNRLIEEAREELIADGENPDEYFKTVESTRFMM